MKRITLALVLILALAFIPPAGAQFNFGLRPEDQTKGYFTYTLAPGESVSDAVLAVNATDSPLPLVVRVVAGRTGLTGGIAFADEADQGPRAAWVTLPDAGVVAVPPRRALRLPFTLAVPPDTPPGEHVVGFLAALTVLPEVASAGGGMQVQVIPQSGVSVIVTVPGPQTRSVAVESLAIGFENEQWRLALGLRNTGNVHWQGKGKLTLRPAAGGEPALKREFNIGYFVAGDAIAYPLYSETLPPAGDYLAEIALTDEDGAPAADYAQTVSIKAEAVGNAAATATAIRESVPTVAPRPKTPVDSSAGEWWGVGLFVAGLAALSSALIWAGIRWRQSRRREKTDLSGGQEA